ncbi:MAG: 2,3-bisphosphoglycerate-independent phosphoglycerate mutase [Deltaproteobacteria bacterium]|nr:MAG: 2,3-bisphosphoglycerate-independent phosphoglycerate mutase [Deltaproteobacteria bacterium]
MDLDLLSSLAVQNDTKVLLLVLDGVGGLAGPQGKTSLEAAHTPNLDALAKSGVCGFHDPVAPGITPGSGPAHIGLFGYDPFRYLIGRGVLDTAGTPFVFATGDLASRLNFATLAADGTISDRRAGRIPDEEGQRVTDLLAKNIKEIEGVQVLLQHVKEYRAAAIFRGKRLDGHLCDSDPQKVGLKPLDVAPTQENPTVEAKEAARLANTFIVRAKEILAAEAKANFVMMRGFDVYEPLPDFCELFKWRACAVAGYPMYKGVAKLAGMRVIEEGQSTVEEEIDLVIRELPKTDFLFLHVKKTDSKGEDGDFEGKVEVIEHFDRLLPRLVDLKPDVFCVTGDHSTPCSLRSHSWHPVPICIAAETARVDACQTFSETSFLTGGLGRIHSTDVVPLLLAHAERLQKYGA